MKGVEAIDSSATSYSCTPILTIGTSTHSLSSSVTYTSTLTPYLTSISPRYGTVEGGTSVTFTGTNFPTSTSDVTINIDERACTVTSATSTQIVCTTSNRPGLFPDTSLEFVINGKGNVAT